MAIDMSQFYQVFFEESVEHLEAMEQLLLGLDLEHPDPEDLNAIFRAAHSIKGSSATFGFTDLAETTHILENLLDRIRKNELALRPDMVDAFLEARDLLNQMLEAHQGHGEVEPQQIATLCERLRGLSEHGTTPRTKTPSQPKTQKSKPAETANRTFNIEFVPTLQAVKSEGLRNFLTELATLGNLKIEKQPAPDDPPPGFWQLRLDTRHDQDKFSEQLDFIADNGAWRVAEDVSCNAAGDAEFGFFGDAPGVPDEERGYGFFEPLPSLPATEGEEGDGYGFFEALPPVQPAADHAASSVAVEDDGYGFFEPLPQTPQTVDAPLPEEGDGYGFFAPLPKPAAQAPAPLNEEIQSKPEPPSSDPKRDSGTARPRPAAGSDSSIRVSVEKVDQLINLVGELVITQAMLLQTAVQMQDSAPESLLNGLTQLERNTRDLQESVMSIRMLPISFVFSRFPRVVRDLSAKLGKQVELKTIGETTELDKSLIERIADPLTHLIRNSLDHGIETPENRVAAGKSPVGTITLKAYHQGGNIVIEVGDDGAGINRQKILAKARERGLLVSDQMSDQEVFALIFEAGFSTADQITDVSGRGVGMDVVRRNIQAMGGRVDIESMLGIGTRMTVRLPLTLAILDGMSVAVGDQIYILPLAAVVESLQPKAGDIKTMTNRGRVIQVRNEYLPLIVLHEIFGLHTTVTDFTQGILVILDADGSKAALFVDALVGQHQVVIKSLEANYRRVPGISGATIMGDGTVAMILDASAIAAMVRSGVQKAIDGK